MRALVIAQKITRKDERSIGRYLQEIQPYGVLAPDEEVFLFKRYRQGDHQAYEKLVLHNLRFVISVAKQYQYPGFWLGDLISEGNIGLIKAIQRFDETKGFKFISYGVWWIRQAILESIREKARKIRLPASIQDQLKQQKKAQDNFLQRQGRLASIDELAEMMGISEQSLERQLAYDFQWLSLDAPMDAQEDAGNLLEVLADDRLAAPDDRLDTLESARILVHHLLEKLPPKLAFILSAYYGIEDNHPLTLDAISDQMGLSRERIRQMMQRGLLRLRNLYATHQATL